MTVNCNKIPKSINPSFPHFSVTSQFSLTVTASLCRRLTVLTSSSSKHLQIPAASSQHQPSVTHHPATATTDSSSSSISHPPSSYLARQQQHLPRVQQCLPPTSTAARLSKIQGLLSFHLCLLFYL